MHTDVRRDAAGTRAMEFADSAAAYVIEVLTWAILIVCLLVWAVVGFVFWIPLLVRATVLFSVALVHATLNRESAEKAGGMLREAVNFYRRGFVLAVEAIQGSPARDPGAFDAERDVNLRRLVNELGWAVLIWYVLLLWLGVIQTSPVDVWRAIVGVPWLDMFDSAVAAVVDFFRGLTSG